jgi:hypothetical protein
MRYLVIPCHWGYQNGTEKSPVNAALAVLHAWSTNAAELESFVIKEAARRRPL